MLERHIAKYWTDAPNESTDPISHFRSALSNEEPWHRVLLGTIGLWVVPEEEYQGRHLKYLLHGEAFDWLLLAERLVQEVDELIPAIELENLLFNGQFPEPITTEDFRDLVGPAKYQACRNYWYGVVVEEGLLAAVEEEVYKSSRASGVPDDDRMFTDAYLLVYDSSCEGLMDRFWQEKGLPANSEFTLSEYKDFTYSRFKYRMNKQDGARFASDTVKGLEYCRHSWNLSLWEEA